MKFLLSVIAVCLVMITAKLYVPTIEAQECGTFDEETLMYVICELPTVEELDKRIIILESDMQKISEIKKDIKVLKNRNNSSSGLTAKQVLELVDDKCRANSNGYNKMHPHSISCKT
jgi:hypothetical protein